MKIVNMVVLLKRFQLPLLIALLSVLIAIFDLFLDHSLSELLRYQRSTMETGDLWRYITAHFVHLGWSHLWLNLAGLFLIWALFGQFITTRNWLLLIGGCSVAISGMMMLWLPDLEWYVGLSGVLHSMFVAGAIAAIIAGHRTEIILLLVITAKLIYEFINGPLPGSEGVSGGNVIVESHLYGAIAGFTLMLPGLIKWARQQRKE